MYSYFTDLHVELLARGILQPGEQLVAKTVTTYLPWWAFGFINKTYLVLATDQRLVLVEHRFTIFHQAQRLHAVESIPWAQVQEAKVGGFLKKKLRVRGQTQTGIVDLKAVIPNQLFGLLAPMKNNMMGARAIAQTFQTSRQLGAPAAQPAFGAPPSYNPASLPPAQAYGAPPALPQQNAPGYSSVPPQSYDAQRSAPPPIPGRGTAPRPPQF